MTRLRLLAGGALLIGAYAPLHRLLDPARTGPAGSATRAVAESTWTLGVAGTLIVVTFCWLLVRMIPAGRISVEGARSRLTALVSAPSPARFALGLGTAVAAGTTFVALSVHGGVPTTVDEMAQLLHAGAIAGGRLTVPTAGSGAAWVIQNGVLTESGWASIYPPLHTLLLALGLAAGASWLVGPCMTGLATGLVTLAAERSMGTIPGRTTGLLLAVSPFWILIGATHLSHTTAAAALALVLYSAFRAQAGSDLWGLMTGVGVGAAVCARPWVGLACAVAIVAVAWWPGVSPTDESAVNQRTPRWAGLPRRVLLMALGGAPFAALLFAWNTVLFGAPTRLGYSVAFGPAHGLGFHVDPWGNRYGFVEALAYSGADLSQLGVRLFESPVPALAILGCGLLYGRLRRSTALFATWAVAAVAANALYWHHGIHMGPRMLYESTPAWVALFVAAASPFFAGGHVDSHSTPIRLARMSVAAAVLGGLVFAPSAARAPAAASATITPSAGVLAAATDSSRSVAGATDDGARPIVVFVHGSWSSRIAARLSAAGMRRDSIETALRRNDVCDVDRYARFRVATIGGGAAPSGPAPTLDLESLPGTPASLSARALSPGNMVRVSPTSPPDATCLREAQSDRLGVLELELLAWRVRPDGPTAFVRDLGPFDNRAVLEALGRDAFVYVESEGGGRMLDYDEGMRLLWGDAAATGDG